MSKRIGANQRTIRRERTQRVVSGTRQAARFVARTALIWSIALTVIAGAIVAAVGTWRWVSVSPRFIVRQVIVTHGNHVSTRQIISRARIAPGTHIAAVAPAQIRERIRKLSWVREVSVQRKLPNTVIIRVREREPFALVGLGTVHQVDGEGVLLPLERGKYLRLPLITGVSAAGADGIARLTPQSLKGVKSFLAQMTAADSLLARRIAQIDCGGGVWRIILEDSPLVLELPGAELAEKVKQLQQVLLLLRAQPGAVATTINCRYRNLAFVN